ncbi:MAG: sulfatase [Planctomycetota bacterium]
MYHRYQPLHLLAHFYQLRRFSTWSIPLAILLVVWPVAVSAAADLGAKVSPNLLIITVDDMSCDSMGAYGSRLGEVTPNMDALAKSALRFDHAHVVVGNCMPSRNVMWSGRYPHNNGVEGFYEVKEPSYPVLCDVAKQAGYFTAIRHKVSHSTPYSPYAWDLVLDQDASGQPAHVKDAASYGESTRMAIESARKVEKPFCAMINISDPHKPFWTEVKSGSDPHVPSRVFEAHEVPVPGFLPEDSTVRFELGLYYSSVRRADDAVGAILAALKQSGEADNTVIVFLSDHGMPLPFAKTQLYHHSTRTPLMFHWPGVTEAGAVEKKHMVSAVDLLPTLCEILEWSPPAGMDGRSFAPLLKGKSLADREFVLKEYNENSGRKRNPMRGIETKEYLYLYNPWSNGELKMATATNGTRSWKRMKQMAGDNTAVAARVELMEYRVLEELYHIPSDPECLVNLAGSDQHRAAMYELRSKLLSEMQRTGDPVANLLRDPNDLEKRDRYMERVQAEADQRRKQKRTKSGSVSPQQLDLFRWSLLEASQDFVRVRFDYDLPAKLGTKPLIVTLKGSENERLERVQKQVQGKGSLTVEFKTPANIDVKRLRLAAYVGKDYSVRLQYKNSVIGKFK